MKSISNGSPLVSEEYSPVIPGRSLLIIATVLFAVFVSIVTPGIVAANASNDLRTIQIFFENDLFSDTDKYYTNAVQATMISKDLRAYSDDDRLPDWLTDVIKDAPFIKETNVWHNVGVIVGQLIFTPEDTGKTDLIVDDRPYAGYLYGGLAFHRKTKKQLDTLELTLGIVGPSSLAEDAQNTVHRARHIDEALGWDNQLKDEPGAGLSWQRKWRFNPFETENPSFLGWKMKNRDFGMDWIPHAGVTLGNVRTSANAGLETRIGFRLPQDFGSDVIRPGAGISAPLLANHPTSFKEKWGVHLFSAAQVEFVARDIFLDGNTWKESHHVDKEQWIAEISLGLAFNFDTVKLTYRHVFRTRQFENQSGVTVLVH